MSFVHDLKAERLDYYARAGGGAALPAAGMIYWGALAAAGTLLEPAQWCMAAFVFSGAIYPLGLLLNRLTGSDVNARSPFSGLTFAGLLAMMLVWPITIAAFSIDPALVPLSLAVGMTLHWPIVGWMYGKPLIYTSHALIRTGAATAIWFLYPDERYVLIPAAVVGAYALAFVVIVLDRPKRHALAA